MRTLIDLSEPHLRQLTQLARRRKVSRAQLVRDAVAGYLEQQPEARSANDWVARGAGALKDAALALDGVAYAEVLDYERAIRADWNGARTTGPVRMPAAKKPRR